MDTSRKFTMPFEPRTIEHLGLRLYSTLPPVISELVSNAYDAESESVEVKLPNGPIGDTSEVIVRDYGHGLSADELQNEYLPIGRARRGENNENRMSKNGKRRVTGRKGLGKLSAFGVAEEMEIRSIRDGRALCLRLNYPEMKKWAKEHPGNQPYEPTFVESCSGETSERNGIEVTLRRLHRRKAINPDELRRGLARRLPLIESGFDVTVNGTAIGPGDRFLRSHCVPNYSWDVTELPPELQLTLPVSGWFGFLSTSSQVGRGVDIFASKKSVELNSFFNYESTHAQFARAHLVGEIHADFLDGDEDLASTARNSVVWETENGLIFQEWGRKVLKWLFDEWLRIRKQDKEVKVIKTAGFDKWLESRQPREQKIAQRMVMLLVDDVTLEPDSVAPLLEIVKYGVESAAFRDLIDEIEKTGGTASTVLKLFDEWRVIEAREHLQLADGRLAAMEQLETYIEGDVLEVQQMQPLLEKHLWLIDPSWKEADGQTTYTKALREKCIEPKSYEDVDRRIDIFGVSAGAKLTVTELKRPGKTLSREDLDQIARYVDWARTQFEGSTGPHASRYVDGLLIVGKLSSNADIQKAMKRLKQDDIRVETYADLLQRAKEYYGIVEDRLKTIAPEYARSGRKKKSSKDKLGSATKGN